MALKRALDMLGVLAIVTLGGGLALLILGSYTGVSYAWFLAILAVFGVFLVALGLIALLSPRDPQRSPAAGGDSPEPSWWTWGDGDADGDDGGDGFD